ncbi:sensor histidine kinase, partial [Escherichia coli]|nr:sensor histidine kinase [Escherichia coli]
ADPQVAKALPRLERALSRAANLSRNVLEYGKSEEPPAQKTRVPLNAALTLAAEDAGLAPDGVKLVKQLAPRFAVEA